MHRRVSERVARFELTETTERTQDLNSGAELDGPSIRVVDGDAHVAAPVRWSQWFSGAHS
jgi:hypothetical protein